MSIYKVLYPSKGVQLLDGGLNTKFEKSIIEPNESPDCKNVIFNAGSVGTRDGFRVVNTASVGTFVCDGLYTRQGTNNAETMVAFYGGNAYTLDGTSLVTIPSAQSVFTMANRVGAAQAENHIFFGNGGVTPYKYNGTNFTRHGVPAPTQTAAFATGAAGNPNGLYSYKFTYINSASVEGNPSSASADITVASTKISITSIPVAPQSHGVNSRRIYRNVTSGATWFLVTTLNDNTTTTYTDDTADASLAVAAPSDKGEPPTYSTIIFHQGRLFMNDVDNPSFVRYTDLNEPFTVGSANFQIIGDTSTDTVMGFAIQDNSLVIFGKKAVWLWYMSDTDPTNWRVVKSKSPFSSKSPFASFNYNNLVGFPAVQNDVFAGIAALRGDTTDSSTSFLTVAAVGSNLKSDKIEPDMFQVQSGYLGNISSIVFQNQVLVALTYGANQTKNNRVYVMDFSNQNMSNNQTESWSPWTGLNVAQFAIYGGDLYYGSSTATGTLHKQDVGVYADNGTAIDSYFWTKEFTGIGGHDSYNKDFRQLNMLVDLAGDYNMGLAYRVDSDSGMGTTYDIDLDPDASLWGSMVWGVDTWGAGNYQQDLRVFLGGTRGKRIQFKFSNKNTANQRFKVHWINFNYNLKGPR